MKYKTNYIKIENLKQYLIESIKDFHPDDPRHLPYWKEMKKHCIEGFWGYETGIHNGGVPGYRYCPGRLFFYGNFATILGKSDEQKTRPEIKPYLRDIEWERAYMLLEAEGFSGWSEDDEFTSDIAVLDVDEIVKGSKRYLSLYSSSGKLKTYIPPRINIKKLHKKKMGLPLYYNEAKNIFECGSRGGGKSYWYSLGVVLHALCFNAVKYYTKESIEHPPKAELCIGSGQQNKSAEFIKKAFDAMNALATKEQLGAWGTLDAADYSPSIFYKEMSGTIKPNNKDNLWRHEYKVLEGGREIIKGSKSYVAHVTYSPNKPDGASAASGGRYNYNVYEEVGLCFGKDTEIRMFDGSIKNVQDIVVGDIVMGHDGNERTVKVISSGEDNLYKISQRFGDDYIVNSRHKLCLYNKYNNKHGDNYWTCEAQDFSKMSSAKQREQYGYKTQFLNFKERKLKLDPYWFGSWIGDGSVKTTSIAIEDIETEVRNYYRSLASKENLRISTYSDKKSPHVLNLNFVNKKGAKNKFREALRYYNVFNNKQIPIDFIHNSEQNRLELLAGLLDTDGCYVNGKTQHHYEFYQTNREELIDQVCYLCMSLGFRAVKSVRVICKGYGNKVLPPRNKYTIRISGDISRIPCKIPRKQAQKRNHLKLFTNTAIKVNNGGVGKYYGFELEESPYFILKDGTVVHNTTLLEQAWLENQGTVIVEGEQLGVQIGLGTSGSMETVMPTKNIFTHPSQYNVLQYNDDWEETGFIGFFLPAYMTVQKYKDIDGNTDVEKAVSHFLKRREDAAKADNPYVLASEKMKYPLVPSDMWQSTKGDILPVNEAQNREKELVKHGLYQKLGTPVELIWNSSYPNGVQHKVDNKRKPFYEHKFKHDRNSLDGPIMIYEFPQFIGGAVPNDMYKFIGFDPYVSDRLEEGDSLGIAYIMMNPKYIPDGFNGNTIVASYISKTPNGRKEYNENLEKLMAMYGNPIRGLWFEANRGDEVKNHFLNKNKQSLLALRPERVQSSSIYQKRITQYGFIVGNRIAKVEMLDKFSEWLLAETTLSDGTKRNIERIPCRFLIQQIQQFNLETGNYDAVMAMLGCIIGLKEEEYNLVQALENKNKHNPLTFLSQNPNAFKQPDPLDNLRKKLHKFQDVDEEEETVFLNFNDKWNDINIR